MRSWRRRSNLACRGLVGCTISASRSRRASPGEIKTGGRGLEIVYGFADTPFGLCLLAECARGICWIEFVEQDDDDAAIRAAWFGARLTRDDEVAGALADRVFAPEKRAGSLKALVRGSRFQVRVWRALLRIPEGKLAIYATLAKLVDRPGAARAVGTAVGGNPLAYLIPCHRVIRGTGVVGDYRWGTARKRAMIGREGAGQFTAAW